MKSLMLLRHADALPASPGLADSDRALSPRGQAQAQRLGECLRERGWTPQLVLCSSALRARQTAEGLAAAAAWTTPLTMLDQLYNANADDMLSLLHEQAEDIERLLLVAHAPGIAELASALASPQSDPLLSCEPATLMEMVAKVASWSDLACNGSQLKLVLPG